jgi:hypothetical protein
LTDIRSAFTLQIPQIFSAASIGQDLTERGKQKMGQEKPSHDKNMAWRTSLVVCNITRL